MYYVRVSSLHSIFKKIDKTGLILNLFKLNFINQIRLLLIIRVFKVIKTDFC